MINVMEVNRGENTFNLFVGPSSTVLSFSNPSESKRRVVTFQALPLNIVKAVDDFLGNPRGSLYVEVRDQNQRLLCFDLEPGPEVSVLRLRDTSPEDDPGTIQLTEKELKKLRDTLLEFWTC